MISQTLKRYWGFDCLRPLQNDVIETILARRDCLAVMPTGGGKSLCYQLPVMCMPGMAIVVSPLIALMKDQVDSLNSLGIAAAAINSVQGANERRSVAQRISAGKLKLLYMAPERLLTEKTLSFLSEQEIAFVAVDEAHCISSWGHDFRPEYRELKQLRQVFPKVAIHAFTATATPRVRADIVNELELQQPQEFVGDFRRPNLIYRAMRRDSGINQICSVLDQHRDSSGIVYCISRAGVEKTSERLNALGYKTLPYHAGMHDHQRAANQDAFVTEQVETIVATIAFGMGIDKSNVRYVVHSGMPRSIENYQQESGRAGRDGLPSECWLLYSPNDLQTWKMVIEKNEAADAQAANASLDQMYHYCTSVTCRHQFLTHHFGQSLTPPCGSCDVCLNELRMVAEPSILAQKILSCVLRLHQRFGSEYVASVLRGSSEKKILQLGHNKLSTWGLLKDSRKAQIRDWIEQLVGQEVLVKFGEYQQLQLTELGHRVLRGEQTPVLLEYPITKRRRLDVNQTPSSIIDSWEGVDRQLFEELRRLRMRRGFADQVPNYIIFSDLTLRDMARRRPSSIEQFLSVHGVGDKKAEVYGQSFLQCISDYCHAHRVEMDVVPEHLRSSPINNWQEVTIPNSLNFPKAVAMFREGKSVSEVAEQLGLAASTIHDYLVGYAKMERMQSAAAWVSPYDIQRIELALDYAAIVDDLSKLRLKPVYDALHGTVDYSKIRLVLQCRLNR